MVVPLRRASNPPFHNLDWRSLEHLGYSYWASAHLPTFQKMTTNRRLNRVKDILCVLSFDEMMGVCLTRRTWHIFGSLS
ncbi:hypothetical protein F0562_030240 [Nyssa sinensis]|uniref:Uncharacterized protein n=1 Tax=Nyssa sinensis TaxID=561372 RepID=A0A5J5B0F1_9ASTE|nr:hypothetical protein F0562_030240 [Nyssa sinensis]